MNGINAYKLSSARLPRALPVVAVALVLTVALWVWFATFAQAARRVPRADARWCGAEVGQVVNVGAPSGDMTGAIERAINNAPNGSATAFTHVRLQAGAVYNSNGPIRVAGGKHHLCLDGRGATIQRTSRNSDQQIVMVKGNTDLGFMNFTLKGSYPAAYHYDDNYGKGHAFGAGFQMRDVNGFELFNVTVRDSEGDWMFMAGDGGPSRRTSYDSWVRNGRIHHSRFRHSGRQGISPVSARDIRIDHNYMGDSALNMIDFEPMNAGQGYSDVMIAHNTIDGGMGTKWVSIGGHSGGGCGVDTNRIHIHHNLFTVKDAYMQVHLKGGDCKITHEDVRIYDNFSRYPSNAHWMSKVQSHNNREVFKVTVPSPGSVVENNVQPLCGTCTMTGGSQQGTVTFRNNTQGGQLTNMGVAHTTEQR
jgi:hypothetical protein